ncbi:MAG: hypothetical protein ACOZBH_00765 [Patescibacteria group bacterium]
MKRTIIAIELPDRGLELFENLRQLFQRLCRVPIDDRIIVRCAFRFLHELVILLDPGKRYVIKIYERNGPLVGQLEFNPPRPNLKLVGDDQTIQT